MNGGPDQRAEDRASRPADQHAEAAGPVGGPLAREIVLGQREDHALVVHHVRADQPPPAAAGHAGWQRQAVRQVAGVHQQPGQRRRDGAAGRRDDPDEQELRRAGQHEHALRGGHPEREPGGDRDRPVGQADEEHGQAGQRDVPQHPAF